MSLAEQRKEEGNRYFQMGKFSAAIDAYSECICLEPKAAAVYYTNRAMCWRQKEDWAHVIADCKSALQLDPRRIKAHYFLGVALCQTGDDEAGILELARALQLTKEQTVSYRDDIKRAMLAARKRQWTAQQPCRQEALRRCEALLPQLRRAEAADASGAAPMDCDGAASGDGGAGDVGACLEEALSLLRARHTPAQIPDHLCCKISMEVMLDPVVTPSGATSATATAEPASPGWP
jgi:STIP1 family protein 1